jgi:hypothetical protein
MKQPTNIRPCVPMNIRYVHHWCGIDEYMGLHSLIPCHRWTYHRVDAAARPWPRGPFAHRLTDKPMGPRGGAMVATWPIGSMANRWIWRPRGHINSSVSLVFVVPILAASGTSKKRYYMIKTCIFQHNSWQFNIEHYRFSKFITNHP